MASSTSVSHPRGAPLYSSSRLAHPVPFPPTHQPTHTPSFSTSSSSAALKSGCANELGTPTRHATSAHRPCTHPDNTVCQSSASLPHASYTRFPIPISPAHHHQRRVIPPLGAHLRLLPACYTGCAAHPLSPPPPSSSAGTLSYPVVHAPANTEKCARADTEKCVERSAVRTRIRKMRTGGGALFIWWGVGDLPGGSRRGRQVDVRKVEFAEAPAPARRY
ncbi:hypothetical protein K438DRAFT_1858186, partial [Mycena galopus ATCC 62051]